ncbi:fungal-specific transcription factor domain-containing protein [Mycena rosella]|uniref:Fungal-specific transcription factor domain-containing protein n=1 Tax=Mycena rosella TaxID=1033263 RepID=A0AAD7DRR8_MYCRO|nr:fungal-specific transcription factor domain-containing protein [Mycena rosella]
MAEPTRPKRRRLKGACDICKKQKARCDSAEMPGNRCSNCIAFQSECTHSGRAKGGSPSANATSAFNPLQTAPEHITSILSGSKEYVSFDPSALYQVLLAVAQYARRLEEALAMTATGPSHSIDTQPLISTETSDDTDTDSDDGVLVSNLSEPLRQITRDVSSNRFYGKSSNLHFVKVVMDMKREANGDIEHQTQVHRPEFWNVLPWEITPEIFVPQLFPEPELLKTLLEIFFDQINSLIYVVHAPTVRSAVAAGLHSRDQNFGAVVLTACALGAKFSEDPRVFLEGTNSEHSAGWRWFRQVRPVPTSFLVAPSLYDLQLICLSLLYLAGGSSPEECWTLVGLGVRMAYDVGAHRRIRSRSGETIESEMYRRTFWMLLCSDTIMSSLMGRPRGTAIEELDIALPAPLEGEDPIAAIYGALLIKLLVIWRRVQDAIHPIKRKEQEVYQEIVAELDSALNHWVDSVPDQLRWDPHRQNLIRLNQSACLYVTYYHVQIHLHRPFIPSKGNHSSLSSISFPSLAICANAARSCGHVMEVQATRAVGPLYNPQIISAVFDSATVLLLNVFHRSSPATDQSVHKCLNVLRVYERRWQIAGRNADILAGMLEGHDQASTVPPSLKRTRSSDDYPPSTSENVQDVFEEPRNIAGSKRIAAMTEEIEQLRFSEQEFERLLFLPLHTEDLGRLPVYESFDFDSIFNSDAFSESAVGADPPSQKFHEPSEAHWDDWSSYSTN